jgi:GT2 family glycosyltransferase
MLMKIAVLMTCHNRREKTLECLRYLYGQNGINTDFKINVFLVDDGSTDGTSIAVSSAFPKVNISKGDGNLYWNRGMNLAWRTAANHGDFDYYLWLNDDTVIVEDAILEMLNCIRYLLVPGIVCGAICSDSTQRFTYGGVTKKGIPIEPNGNIQHCDIINGNCVLVSQEVFQLIGNLDPIFPHAIGDHDYGLRLLKKGGAIITTRKYIGYCERNVMLPKWCYKETPFFQRLNNLYSPLGNSHPKYFFIYENRHFGIFRAVKHFLSIHLRVILPRLWK